ncbi:MAG: cobyric acid synthase [Chloroflexi bacterium]|jgi:adenosylcobyric acid synthase|nr:cobyric acid synthase [Chloroflexota bacterium]
MTAKVLMVQGTSSSVGKSLLTAALCRIYTLKGVRVAPFKAQNMSNNAAVCPDGSEIGRAQAVQAIACGLQPTAEMNPILLKPEADTRSQVIVMGRPWGNPTAREYYKHRDEMWRIVTGALDRLREQYDLVIMEGAGSPVELNLKDGDIVNMAIASYAQAAVLLAGDIDRGGIFAQLLGTLWLLPPEERALVKGLLVNKFRGDSALFIDGVRILEERGNVPVLGVIPWLPNLAVPEEDAVALDTLASRVADVPEGRVDIAVIHLPHIANFDDFDPLAAEAGVRLRYVSTLEELGQPHAIILPGTKSTLADLGWLQAHGLADAIVKHAERGGAVVGICGGYQMLGRAIYDPQHAESRDDHANGLGLLPVETVFNGPKATYQAKATIMGGPGWLGKLGGVVLEGYEIHVGQTTVETPWLSIMRRGQSEPVPDGADSYDGRVWGCYLHGLFASAEFRRAWLTSMGWQEQATGQGHDVLEQLDRLAAAVERELNMELLEKIIWER